MSTFLKRYSVKLPDFISIFYCEKLESILIKGPLNQNLIKLKLKLLIDQQKKLIIVTSSSFKKLSAREKKKIKNLQGITASKIKKSIYESSSTIYKKLKFVGVGYKAFSVKIGALELINLKLGYSHDIFVKASKNININPHKATVLFISGTSLNEVSRITSLIKNCRPPEPYKGKGILYENEQIKLKEGKKV
jgi:large subunit ribosomal protein L6